MCLFKITIISVIYQPTAYITGFKMQQLASSPISLFSFISGNITSQWYRQTGNLIGYFPMSYREAPLCATKANTHNNGRLSCAECSFSFHESLGYHPRFPFGLLFFFSMHREYSSQICISITPADILLSTPPKKPPPNRWRFFRGTKRHIPTQVCSFSVIPTS